MGEWNLSSFRIFLSFVFVELQERLTLNNDDDDDDDADMQGRNEWRQHKNLSCGEHGQACSAQKLKFSFQQNVVVGPRLSLAFLIPAAAQKSSNWWWEEENWECWEGENYLFFFWLPRDDQIDECCYAFVEYLLPSALTWKILSWFPQLSGCHRCCCLVLGYLSTHSGTLFGTIIIISLIVFYVHNICLHSILSRRRSPSLVHVLKCSLLDNPEKKHQLNLRKTFPKTWNASIVCLERWGRWYFRDNSYSSYTHRQGDVSCVLLENILVSPWAKLIQDVFMSHFPISFDTAN